MKSVLIVDNSRLMRSILKELFTELGLETIGEAVDVEEGLKAYQALRPDLVTLDLILPGRPGLEMLKAILSSDPDAKVLVIADSDQPSVEQQVLSSGACGMLHKPVTREELQRAIENIETSALGRIRPKSGKPKALVIDDSLVMRSMIKDLLADLGVETVGEAIDAVEAVKAYQNLKPDFATLDLIMPGGSGFDALKKILVLDPKAKIIVISSVAPDSVSERALRLGACAVLQKPLSQEMVKNILDKIFSPTIPLPPDTASSKASLRQTLKDLTSEQYKSLEDIFRSGSESCLRTMDAMWKARWKVAGVRFLSGASPEVADIMDASYVPQVTSAQMLLAKDIPAVCLVFISRKGAQQIMRLLTQNQRGETGQELIHLVLTEWANILITAIIDAFGNILGSARVSATPSLVEGPPEEVLPGSIKELSDVPERSVLVRVQYSCEGLGADCETLFIFRADSMSKLLRVNA